MPVDLTAELSDKTNAPARAIAPKPEEKPAEPPKQDVPKPPEPPKPEPPKPEPPKPEPPKPPPPPPPPAPKPPEPEPEPIPVPSPKPKPPEPIKPKDEPKKPKPKDDFFDMMDKAVLKDMTKPKPVSKPQPAPQPQNTPAVAGSTNSQAVGDPTAKPTASEQDYLRAQIEKCWNFDPGARGAENLIVKVRIQIQPDGTVTRAELDVDTGRYNSDPYDRAAADSARRAPLSCSPLKIPPSRPDFFRNFSDIVLNFDPRSLIR